MRWWKQVLTVLTAAFVLIPAPARSQVWTSTGQLQSARAQHVQALLPNGKVLATGSIVCTPTRCVGDDTTEVYDPATGSWSMGPRTSIARSNHVAVPLANGKILVAGGYVSPAVLTGASELYDPATNIFAPTGSLNTPRQAHTGVRLPGGKVLIAGGQMLANQAFTVIATAELYDPATGRWSLTGSMHQARLFHTLTLLGNGKVLAAGGASGFTPDDTPIAVRSAELFDPATGRWTSTANLMAGRNDHSATLLPDGRVLVAAGGNDTDAFATTELYDATSQQWIAGPSLTEARALHQATLLGNGRVLIAGGTNDFTGVTNLPSSELLRTPEAPPGSVVTVSDASFADNSTVAPDFLAAALGTGLSPVTQAAANSTNLPLSLGGVSARVRDSAGKEQTAPLWSVSPGQITFNIPAGTQNGLARVTILQGEQTVATGDVRVTSIAPGLFSADGSGSGPLLANAIRVRANGGLGTEAVARFENDRFVTVPIDLGPEGDQVVLVLFGTGIRGLSAPQAVAATVGTVPCDVLFAGPSPEFPAVDQVDIRLSQSLAGSGEVDLELAVDGRRANTVRVNIR